MAELKPCPNCGCQAKLHKKSNKFYVECDGDCWTQTSKHSYQEEAEKEWNSSERRKKETELLPCPFCGSLPKLYVKKGIRNTLRCTNPQCYLFYFAPTSFCNGDSDEHAELRLTKWWNRRAEDV